MTGAASTAGFAAAAAEKQKIANLASFRFSAAAVDAAPRLNLTQRELYLDALRAQQVSAEPDWERSFQFRPFAVDMHGALGEGATVFLMQFARKVMVHDLDSWIFRH